MSQRPLSFPSSFPDLLSSSIFQRPLLLCFPSQHFSFLSTLGGASPGSQKTPAGTSLTYFGTISARSAREATGTLESLGTGRATFTWETSFTLGERHQDAVRQEW